MDHEGEAEGELSTSEVDWGDQEPCYIHFSGHSQGSRAYLRWERDMDDWFLANKVPELKKMTYAEETLAKEAYMIWDIDVSLRDEYHEPAATWDEMKQLMSEEFMRDDDDNIENETPPNLYAYPRPSLWILAPKQSLKPSYELKISAPSKEELLYTEDVLNLLATSEDEDVFHSKLKLREDATNTLSQVLRTANQVEENVLRGPILSNIVTKLVEKQPREVAQVPTLDSKSLRTPQVSSVEHKENYLIRIQTDGVMTT